MESPKSILSAKEQKLLQIQLMKLKSRATPLHPSSGKSAVKPDEMFFFEWWWDEKGERFGKDGFEKGEGRGEAVWVPKVSETM